ncbi:3-deoxy-D-manno-octulosonate 8-phosphate phosphatase [Candidatus Nitrosoglobus terrae]|uniref:3-deoxy-D-manno-octulosonate 8-phosphate phosphatase KdsC n=1 Tax=Candidatus Nitrosoglobus terrae TaxID=1630141 RepID=A0A1Q2SPC0_9GAMM|nr:3-deoxy-manno-octulosonate-8-phosphatase KdsC [Candidatus Nitrosoglobus terrae]BAW80988.1 3-deoxy-D-manno-octulosonate 8-phosphate phosphatase [Candidatus Nitrosoglobus terrae]
MLHPTHDILDKALVIKLAIFDVDGVLTDGGLHFGSNGQEYKVFHARDGHGMKMLQHTGVRIGIITGRTSLVVDHRMKDLGIIDVYQGQQPKLPAYEHLLQKCKLQPHEIAYVGDDLVDLAIMQRVGLAITVQDAHPLVKQHAHWITPNVGGRGAARDVCELIMEAQGTFKALLESHY